MTFYERVAMSRERILNHPGHPDQKSHGRGGVRDALAGAKTIEELNDAARAEAKRITGRNIEFDFGGSDLRVAKEHAEGVLQGLERYPSTDVGYVGSYGPGSAAPRMLELSLHSDSYAVTIGSAIYLNNRFAADGGAYRRALTHEPPIRSQVARDPRGVALHEFGHRVAERGRSDGVAGVVAERGAARVGETPEFHITRHISSYATGSDHELAAEAFSDVMTNGSKASSLSSTIVSAMDRAYTDAGGTIRS